MTVSVPAVKVESTTISDVKVIQPDVYGDHRGLFFETWNEAVFSSEVCSATFVQDNQSRSARHVLRGLHYQLDPAAQGKLVRVVQGAVFDVAVDIRRGSATFGRWAGLELSEDNRKQLWIPPGFAHGFLALSDQTEVCYKVTAYYSPDHDRSIIWNDPDIGVGWPLTEEPVLSEKDASAPLLRDADLFA